MLSSLVVKATLHLSVFHTHAHAHARKILNASKFLFFDISVNKCILKYVEKTVLSIYSLSFLKVKTYKNLDERVRAYEKRVSGKQLLHVKSHVQDWHMNTEHSS